MSLFLVLTFLFFVGSVAGWVLELFYRRFFSRNNPERKWINPGFLTGPYLPLYGFSLVILFSLSHINVTFILLILLNFSYFFPKEAITFSLINLVLVTFSRLGNPIIIQLKLSELFNSIEAFITLFTKLAHLRFKFSPQFLEKLSANQAVSTASSEDKTSKIPSHPKIKKSILFTYLSSFQ